MSEPAGKNPLSRWIGAIVFSLFVGWIILQQPDEGLIVYCAHDARFAQDVLDAFTDETGIPVLIRYDTEATKSLGLIERIKSERKNPQADVFWNNEFLGMLELANEGLLEPYKGRGWQGIPEAFRDVDGQWTGFGARLRVWAVNTNAMPATLEAIQTTLASDDLSKVGLAKPLYGTTLTHYSALWHKLGGETLKELHRDQVQRGLRILNGNAVTCNLAADGILDLAFTDTDDAFVSLDQQKPISIVPVRIADGKTLVIPNTVAILRGARHREKAQLLVDYLLSPSTEMRLANSASRQIPLGEVDPEQLPDEVKALLAPAADGFPLHPLLDARRACLAWLKSELP